jgi:hypothetical protein
MQAAFWCLDATHRIAHVYVYDQPRKASQQQRGHLALYAILSIKDTRHYRKRIGPATCCYFFARVRSDRKQNRENKSNVRTCFVWIKKQMYGFVFFF